ncbi:cold shock domain-containing protein [Nonomuraea sp. NPDC049419]|uniref:cold-shock protein n=1 Tax=Nonomuraea sp. NPDC049419 TaxID=3155772 RepID=UPI003448C833
MVTGRVLRFDQVRGYGFIAPDTGGADVFLHANDLLDDKHAVRPGTVVEFRLEGGDRGLKASDVRIVGQRAAVSPSHSHESSYESSYVPSHEGNAGDDLCEVLSESEFKREITELLITTVPTLTGTQIVAIRQELSSLAKSYKWVES